MLQLLQSESTAARRRMPVYLVDSTDGVTPETGITFSSGDIKISKNGGSEANHAGTVTELAGGLYYYEATAGELDTLGFVSVRLTKSGVRTFVAVHQVIAINLYDAAAAGLTSFDATISSRLATSGYTVPPTVSAIRSEMDANSTKLGADTAGTTTLLSRLTSTRAGNLDNLDAAISSRSTYAGADTAGTTTLLSRLTSGRAGNLDNLDAAISTRLATAGYTAPTTPPTAAAIADAVWDEVTSGHATSGTAGAAIIAAGSAGDPWSASLPGSYGAGTAGYIVGNRIDATISSRSTYAGADTAGTTTLLSRLTSGRAGSLDYLDASISSRLATAGYTSPPSAASIRQEIDTNSSKIDASISSRLAAASYEAPNNAAILAIKAITDTLGLTAIADAILKRDWTAVSGEASRSCLNALRAIRNGFSIAGSTLTVKKEDGSTTAYTRTITTNASAEPITGVGE